MFHLSRTALALALVLPGAAAAGHCRRQGRG